MPWRPRLAQIAHSSVSKANHNGVAVTSCLSKRMHGKSATMVLMMAGNEPDLVFDSLAPVIALTHAVWDGWMSLATMAKCVRTAQLEQREHALPWAAVKGPFGAGVATLARMQWTPEHDPFLWCMHEESARTACELCSIRRLGGAA